MRSAQSRWKFCRLNCRVNALSGIRLASETLNSSTSVTVRTTAESDSNETLSLRGSVLSLSPTGPDGIGRRAAMTNWFSSARRETGFHAGGRESSGAAALCRSRLRSFIPNPGRPGMWGMPGSANSSSATSGGVMAENIRA
ncbi:MAG: hypothetical protein E6K80_06905 [Candidatus Eisenbacteria bacterium]|uniref:Uncharacterized protein n=1 Tax=Eiseniibacteriota bacterium TaxID=2212470 RepID=A0A538U509_UNCEI|nr:MAG: hypothetical protein E6K80_06905 [Candidatus Eisenbacteria bacterium]